MHSAAVVLADIHLIVEFPACAASGRVVSTKCPLR
jgi:hypothetical protein